MEPVHGGVGRRVFLIMPLAFAGLASLFIRRTRQLPDPAENGSGPEVTLVLFSNNGERETTVLVRKIVKTDREWRAELSGEEYAVTRHLATEFAFTNRYWNTHEPGIYRCACCGNALFRSQEKFDSGTGWPSFSAPIAAENIGTAKDLALSIERVEILCRKCDAHLGHMFDDGPAPTGLRYCMNSAALRFVTRAS